MADSGNIKVVVRCRPMNSRERTRGASNLIEVIDQHQLVLHPPSENDSRENAKSTKKKSMPFSFDRAYGEDTEQKSLFEYVGLEVLEHSFNGFNTCVFAYGQTGSGKSHSMVGYAEAKGLIPLTCSKLFDDADRMMAQDPNLRIRVEVSYIEIYNEKVRDLLNPANKGNLKVREHPSMGPYVEDLSKLVVSSFKDVESLMDEGNKARTVAATNMNETSSRSHAVFTLVLTQRRKDEQTKLEAEKVSRISLVDLAGSERANSTGATGSRLKEGANINRSLTSLGKVIAALAQASMSEGPRTPKKKGASTEHVPYRDSVLTWLLKDSLGGNSKTAMIAAISPADYEETLSTLRYADQAKKIKNKAVVNEDPNAKLIRELKEELEMLRQRAAGGASGTADDWDPSIPPEKQIVRYRTKTGEIKTVTKAELQEQMEQSEKLMSSLNESWEEKLQRTQAIQIEREKALEELGITIDKGNVGVHTPKNLPHLVNLNEDALMNECLLYQLKPGKTVVGNADTPSLTSHIRLSGSKILPEHCTFENVDGVVTLHAAPNSMTMVNGKRVSPDQPKRLRSGYRVILGDFHVFRVNNPGEVRKARDRVKSAMALSNGAVGSPLRPDSPASEDGHDVDWTYARREAIINHLNGQDVGLDHLSNEDLDRLFDDISRVRSRKGTPALGSGSLSRPHSRVSSSMSTLSTGEGSESSLPRPYSMSAFTDDTSIDPWSICTPAGDTSTTTGSAANDEQSIIVDRDESEAEILRAKIKKYERRFSRLDPDGTLEDSDDEPLTESERQLLSKIVRTWKAQTTVSMAEDVLSNSALVREANVIAKELGKQTTYQFTIVDDHPLSNPTSSIESIAGLSDYDDIVDADLAAGAKPCVAIKVLDYEHCSVYVWSIAKLQQRLSKMRNLYTFIDKPEYSQHFSWADPFYESPAPTYTFHGAALVPLLPLTKKRTGKYRLPILSSYTDAIVGQCNVEVKYVSLASPPSRASTGNGVHGKSGMRDTDLIPGHKISFQLAVDSVEGLSLDDASAAHIQLRLSSIAGPSTEKEDTFASPIVDITSPADLSALRLRKAVAIILTAEIISYLKRGFAAVEFHIKAKRPYLSRMAERDGNRARSNESAFWTKQLPSPDHMDCSASRPEPNDTAPKGRLAETELISEQRHDVLVAVELCELDATGEYQPVQVRCSSGLDPGVFLLRQGLQRKLVVRFTHDSGHQLRWSRISKMEIGHIRLLDGKGRMMDATAPGAVTLNATSKQQTVQFQANGVSNLTAWAWWDTSAHDSIFLNRVTAGDQRVLLRLAMEVDVDICTSPLKFSMDVAISIKARDAKAPSKIKTLIETATSNVRTLNEMTAVFAVKLTPPPAIKSRDLWRLDTTGKYVRGQEALGDWKPLGVSFIDEHERLLRGQRQRTESEAWRVLLADLSIPTTGETSGEPSDPDPAKVALATKVLQLWQSAVRQSRNVGLQRLNNASLTTSMTSLSLASNGENVQVDKQISTISASFPSSSSSLSTAPAQASQPATRLTASVLLLPRSDTVAKKGYLMLPLDALADSWTKRWCVLKRPHLHLYTDRHEVEEVQVIHLSAVHRVEYHEHLQALLGRRGVFGLYTASNSYFLQAPNELERGRWIDALHGTVARKSVEGGG